MVKDNRYSESQMVKQEFGMNISEACTTIDARVLPPPMVYFFITTVSCVSSCEANMLSLVL